MLDDEFAAILRKAPEPEKTVNELFKKVQDISQDQLFVALLNYGRLRGEGKSFLGRDFRPNLVFHQFIEYLDAAIMLGPENVDPKYHDVVRRLHILAYSQFWEHQAVKTLLSSLVACCGGEMFEPRPFFGHDDDKTYIFYKSVREKAGKMGLLLAPLLKALYKPQIRNAFAHSDFYVMAGYISFGNHDAKKDWSIPSVKIETWNLLWDFTLRFILALIENRNIALKRLESLVPYHVKISGNNYCIDLDKEGRFVLRDSRIIS